MKIDYIKNVVTTAFFTIIPMKSSNVKPQALYHIQPPMTIVDFKKPDLFIDFTKESSKKSLNLWDYIMGRYISKSERMEALYPKVHKPSINSDITQNLYQGSPEFLNTFLSGVMENKGQVFYNAQQKYGIDAVFLMGITKLESGHGFSNVAKKYNNIGGMRNKNGYIHYANVDECIYAIAKNLRENYADKGLKTPALIGPKYCETGAWPKEVVKQMDKIYKNSLSKMLYYPI